MTPRRRTGILGGTFDPIHAGHLAVAAAARHCLALDDVWLVPTRVPPHRASGPAASTYHRFAMIALACAGQPGFDPCDIELDRPGPSYTADTLRRLHASGYAASQLFFLAGADAFAEIATWKDYPALLSLASFAVTSRPGIAATELLNRLPDLRPRMRVLDPREATHADTVEPVIYLIDCVTPDVSSSGIRARAADGQAISSMVPASVDDYIRRHGLYSRQPQPDGTDNSSGRQIA